MFRKFLLLLCLLTGAIFSASGQDLYEKLDSLMAVYVQSIRTEDEESKAGEADYMIGAAADSATRQHVALWLFDYYKESRVMGEEAVAIHIYDKWFADGTVPMRSEFDEMDAKLFADFNRNSLIGMQAPKISLFKPCRGHKTVPEDGKAAMLWFFDTSCGKCKVEAEVLPAVLEKEAVLPVDFIAVYAGQDKKSWRQFRRSFKVKNPNVKVIHLWDPEIDSDYLRLYGVISTPKLYMVSSRGEIIGRRLEVENLHEMFGLAKIIEDYLNNE